MTGAKLKSQFAATFRIKSIAGNYFSPRVSTQFYNHIAKNFRHTSKANAGADREILLIPSSRLLALSSTADDPDEFIKRAKRIFLRVFKNGLTDSAVGEDVKTFGFDRAMDVLQSCYALEELQVPWPEIKYECSCPFYWHYNKCKHSLAMSILKKGVLIPAVYNITNISDKRRAGRPKRAKEGGALSAS